MKNNALLLAEQIGSFYGKPLEYVMFVFPWDSDPLIQKVELPKEYRERFPNCQYGPDRWACQFLDQLGEEIRKRQFDGKTAVQPIRFSTSSGHGIGKSTLVSWLIKFVLDTIPMSKGMVTANTAAQLHTKTWAELGKWNAISLTAHLWHFTNGRNSMSIFRRGTKEIQDNWRADALTCKEENSESFQGLHAAGACPFYIFDEASGIPDKIFEARSGGATDGIPMWFDFGNPTRKSGYFFENCIGKFRNRYVVKQVDSRSVAITNKALFKEWVDDYGEDSDFVKVKVRGVFPSAGSLQFIASDVVDAAMVRVANPSRTEPLIIGVDVARFGDDSTVLYPRIGMDAKSFKYEEYKGLDAVQVAEKVANMVNYFHSLDKPCSGIFIDGGPLGGVVDILRHGGYPVVDVNFGTTASDRRYRFRVDEMWGRLRDALDRLSLPIDMKLKDQLTQREYGFTQSGQKIALESKKDMKERLGGEIGASPDIADALALTFAQTMSPIGLPGSMSLHPKILYEYDPTETMKPKEEVIHYRYE